MKEKTTTNKALSLPRSLWLGMILVALATYVTGSLIIKNAYQSKTAIDQGTIAMGHMLALHNMVKGELLPLLDNLADDKAPVDYVVSRYRGLRSNMQRAADGLVNTDAGMPTVHANIAATTRDLITLLNATIASAQDDNMRKYKALWKNTARPQLLEFAQSVPGLINTDTEAALEIKDSAGNLVTSAFGALLAAIAMFFVFCVMFSEALLRALRGNPAQLNSAPQESGAAAIDDKNPWSSALQAMQEVMILVDGKGTISNVNRHIAKITDRTAEQLINTSYTDLLLDGCTEPRCGLTVTLDTTGYGECIHKYMGRINDVRIYTVADDSHTIDKNKVCVIRDITNMKEAEEALTDYTGRLQSSNRELQEFAYVASHDLQEPLRKIQTFAQRMQVKCRDQLDEHGQDYLDRMTNAANRMQKLINDLLVYSRIATKAAPFTMIDLSQAAADVISDLQIAIEQSGARIIVDELPTIEGDELQIRQLFQNLISNALKFRRPDVTPELHISVAPVNTAAAGNLPVHLVTNSCQIIVEDNGIGFDNKYTGKMFGMFQRLHGRSQYEGTGIGLAVCKKIVDRHRGTIEAIGEEGKGAKFVIQLPLSQQAQEKNIPPLQEAG